MSPNTISPSAVPTSRQTAPDARDANASQNRGDSFAAVMQSVRERRSPARAADDARANQSQTQREDSTAPADERDVRDVRDADDALKQERPFQQTSARDRLSARAAQPTPEADQHDGGVARADPAANVDITAVTKTELRMELVEELASPQEWLAQLLGVLPPETTPVNSAEGAATTALATSRPPAASQGDAVSKSEVAPSQALSSHPPLMPSEINAVVTPQTAAHAAHTEALALAPREQTEQGSPTAPATLPATTLAQGAANTQPLKQALSAPSTVQEDGTGAIPVDLDMLPGDKPAAAPRATASPVLPNRSERAAAALPKAGEASAAVKSEASSSANFGSQLDKFLQASQMLAQHDSGASQNVQPLLQLGSTNAAPSVHTNPPVVDAQLQARAPDFPQRLAENALVMVADKLKSAEIRLAPDDLGAVMIRIEMKETGADIRFAVAEPHAASVIEDALPKLRETFTQAGLQLGEASVSQRERGAQHEAAQHPQRGNSGRGSADREGDESAAKDGWGAQYVVRQLRGRIDLFA